LRCSKFSLFYLFDDLVGGALKRERNGQAEHLGGLEVDDELKSGWLDHREISRLLAFENAGRANADLVINFVEVGAVRSEKASSVSRALPAVTPWIACPMLRAVASISIGGCSYLGGFESLDHRRLLLGNWLGEF
jgi:hypothetical protein